MRDRRLLGRWRSDGERTARDIAARSDLDSRHKKTLMGMFGQLELRYTPTRCYATLGETTSYARYSVVGKNADEVLVVSHDETGTRGDGLQHIHFEGDSYWISLGPFREFFRRVRAKTALKSAGAPRSRPRSRPARRR
jgi:hypothetical protein